MSSILAAIGSLFATSGSTRPPASPLPAASPTDSDAGAVYDADESGLDESPTASTNQLADGQANQTHPDQALHPARQSVDVALRINPNSKVTIDDWGLPQQGIVTFRITYRSDKYPQGKQFVVTISSHPNGALQTPACEHSDPARFEAVQDLLHNLVDLSEAQVEVGPIAQSTFRLDGDGKLLEATTTRPNGKTVQLQAKPLGQAKCYWRPKDQAYADYAKWLDTYRLFLHQLAKGQSVAHVVALSARTPADDECPTAKDAPKSSPAMPPAEPSVVTRGEAEGVELALAGPEDAEPLHVGHGKEARAGG